MRMCCLSEEQIRELDDDEDGSKKKRVKTGVSSAKWRMCKVVGRGRCQWVWQRPWPRSRPVTWMNCLSRSACHSICCLSPTETPSSSESDATRFPLSESSVPYLHYPVPDNDISCSSHYLTEVAISLAVDSDLQPCLLSPWGQQLCQCCWYNFLRRGHLVFLITSDKDTFSDMSGQTNNLQTVKQVSSVICDELIVSVLKVVQGLHAAGIIRGQGVWVV